MSGSTNRWFRVVADRFDWIAGPAKMRSFKKGEVHYGTKACVEYGLSIGAIEECDPPKDAKVEKSGRVRLNG